MKKFILALCGLFILTGCYDIGDKQTTYTGMKCTVIAYGSQGARTISKCIPDIGTEMYNDVEYCYIAVGDGPGLSCKFKEN
jgi:hypothetical protein